MVRAIDRLRQASNLSRKRRDVELSDGSIFTYYSTPLTMAERDRVNSKVKKDDANAFALQLLVDKATDENGQKIFNAGDIAVLKNEVRDDDLQSLMVAILQEPEGEEELDVKSTGKGA